MNEQHVLFADKKIHEYASFLNVLEWVPGIVRVSGAKCRESAEKILLETKCAGGKTDLVSTGMVFENRQSGFEILKLARELNPKCILIMHTAACPAEVKAKAAEFGVPGIILLEKAALHAHYFAEIVKELLANSNGQVPVAPASQKARMDILELKTRLVKNLTPGRGQGTEATHKNLKRNSERF